MSIEVKVPVLPESVADALILEWTKQVGDSVTRDEILVEVETDKIVLEVPAPMDGVLSEILALAGDTVLAEQILARIEPAVAQAADESESGQTESAAEAASPAAVPDALVFSPAVRRMIEEYKIDPLIIPATGKNGRLTKADVINFQKAAADRPSADSASASVTAASVTASPKQADKTGIATATTAVATSSKREEWREPMSRLRQTIASRLVQAQQTAAMLTTFNEVNMQPVMELRARHKEAFEAQHGARLGFMSFFVKASVVALQKFPYANAFIDGTDIVQHNYNDIGIAVSSPRGLVVPVLRNCETLSFAEIESAIRGFGERARDGKLTLDELIGGTFTLTNGGVFGSMLSTPILNPPQSAIVGMHQIQQRPMAENGEVVIRPMMYLALSYDHRIIDGKDAVQFLVTIKDRLEDPARLLLDC